METSEVSTVNRSRGGGANIPLSTAEWSVYQSYSAQLTVTASSWQHIPRDSEDGRKKREGRLDM